MNAPDLDLNRRILVIDDNPTIHADFRKILCPETHDDSLLSNLEMALFDEKQTAAESSCFQLDSAYQGQEGLEVVRKALAENQPYAMAFVDVRMPPGWDGVETISRIWEFYPGLQIVVCTAYADYSWKELQAKIGRPDSLVVLKKPFDNVEVQQLAHALTSKWLLNLKANLRMAELEALVRQRTEEMTKANRALAAREERFSKAFQGSPFPVALQRWSDRAFVDVNAAFLRFTEYGREYFFQRTEANLSLWKDVDQVRRSLEQLVRDGVTRREATQLRTASGGCRAIDVIMSLLNLEGEPHVLLTLASDEL